MVAVLYDHQFVPPHKFLLLELNCRTYAEIVFDGSFIRPAKYYDFIFSPFRISLRNTFYEVAATYPPDVIEAIDLESKFVNRDCLRAELHLRNQRAYESRVMQDTGFLLLADNCRKFHKIDTSGHRHIIRGQSRGSIQANRWQLGRIPDKDKFASKAVTHKADQVLKQIARTEHSR